MVIDMSATGEDKEKIVEYLKKRKRMLTNRDIAKGIEVAKSLVDKAVAELANEGKLEYQSFGGISYVKLKEDQ